MSEENEPVTKAFLESKLALFHSQLELERSERALKKSERRLHAVQWWYMPLAILIYGTLLVIILAHFLK